MTLILKMKQKKPTLLLQKKNGAKLIKGLAWAKALISILIHLQITQKPPMQKW